MAFQIYSVLKTLQYYEKIRNTRYDYFGKILRIQMNQ